MKPSKIKKLSPDSVFWTCADIAFAMARFLLNLTLINPTKYLLKKMIESQQLPPLAGLPRRWRVPILILAFMGTINILVLLLRLLSPQEGDPVLWLPLIQIPLWYSAAYILLKFYRWRR